MIVHPRIESRRFEVVGARLPAGLEFLALVRQLADMPTTDGEEPGDNGGPGGAGRKKRSRSVPVARDVVSFFGLVPGSTKLGCLVEDADDTEVEETE